jgi:transcriptional regulator with XRE-family HTH domain
MQTIQRTFAYEKLRLARVDLGLSRIQLAFALNCTPDIIYLWETGRAIPPVRRLLHVCETLQIDVCSLFEESDD